METLLLKYDEPDVAAAHSYHVKDPDGYYCQWSAEAQAIVRIGDGITDYSELSAAQRTAAGFTTSVYGSITKIPADYTVEIRNVLAGTRFRLVERPGEIPDGYSFQKYMYNGEGLRAGAADGVSDTAAFGADHAIIVCNLKGWGLRVNKIWTDADYMESRDAVYFAVYVDDGAGNLTPVPDTLRQMPYGVTTLYWYWEHLPVNGAAFARYFIREISITDGTPTVNDEDYVTNADTLSVTILEDGDTATIRGRQKGDSRTGPLTYTVLYAPGAMEPDSNVRADTVANDRTGVILKKEDWSGHALAGATFTLTDDGGALIGVFTSDENGLITVAFLRTNVAYTLTETAAPKGYHALEGAMTLVWDGSRLQVPAGTKSVIKAMMRIRPWSSGTAPIFSRQSSRTRAQASPWPRRNSPCTGR